MARPVDPMRRALPLKEWPEVDRLAWGTAIAEGDILDGQGPVAHWAVCTKETNIQQYGRWLGYLRWADTLDETARPEDRVTRECIGKYNDHLKSIVADLTRLSMLVGLKVVIQAMVPDRPWQWLQDICNRVQRTAKPSKDKRARMLPTPMIYAAALQELASIEIGVAPSFTTTIRYRDALMLALMAARPLRVKNFQSLVLGEHLQKICKEWLLTVPAEETKTKTPVDYYLPKELVPWLETYLTTIRSRFPTSDISDRLWLNRYGTPLGKQFAYLRLVKTSERLLGKPINPHLFRDCAATSLAMVSPDMARAAAPLLGHRCFSTTEKYYIQANNIEAGRKLNAILDDVEHKLEGLE
jgi:site-specific recombinase XerD